MAFGKRSGAATMEDQSRMTIGEAQEDVFLLALCKVERCCASVMDN